jgi:membrane-bound serine protease (ClpP class)
MKENPSHDLFPMNFLVQILSAFALLSLNTFLWADSSIEYNATLAGEGNETEEVTNAGGNQTKAYVIPIRDQIGSPILDILRRGLKNAIRAEADLVILDMHTPGGELGVTLEIMHEIIQAFEHFNGPIITYVNTEATSAGAYIAIATNEIAFAPYGQMGAAEVVDGGGGKLMPR